MKNCTIINVEGGTSLYFCKTPMTYQEAHDNQTDELKLIEGLPEDFHLIPKASFGEPVEVEWRWEKPGSHWVKGPEHYYWTKEWTELFQSDRENPELMEQVVVLNAIDPESKLGAIYVKVPAQSS